MKTELKHFGVYLPSDEFFEAARKLALKLGYNSLFAYIEELLLEYTRGGISLPVPMPEYPRAKRHHYIVKLKPKTKEALAKKSSNTGIPQGVIISALLWQELQKAKTA